MYLEVLLIKIILLIKKNVYINVVQKLIMGNSVLFVHLEYQNGYTFG
jgi:hypothetical protein